MSSNFRILVICLSLVLFGCKEPTSDTPTGTSDAPFEAASALPTPAVTIKGLKPVPANDKFPAGPLVSRIDNEYCNIESVNGLVYQDVMPKTVLRNQTINVTGFIVDKANEKLINDVTLVIGAPDLTQRWTVNGSSTIARQDVSDYYKNFSTELLNSGFSFDLDLSGLANGTYHIFLVSTSGGETVRCDHSRQITIQ
jgi:hypothetical protein